MEPGHTIPILGQGYVRYIDHLGSDLRIVESARISYKSPSKGIEQDKKLLIYLYKNRHTSPFEQAEVTFFLRVPIFVARQLIRHRTANVNEYSARYSELSDDFYVPARTHLAGQSITNRQGAGDALGYTASESAQMDIFQAQQNGVETYHRLLTTHEVSRETARIVTSVGTYTEMYWKCDLHNFLHFLNLRMDEHAQQEIRELATAMYRCAQPFFPIIMQAWNDYVRESYTLSVAECRMLGDVLKQYTTAGESWPTNNYGMSDREHTTFKLFLDRLLSK